MPCPHNEITIVQRSQRQSAVAAAAYQSGEKDVYKRQGPAVRQMEARGIATDKGELNRWIKATNALLKDLKQKIKALFGWLKAVSYTHLDVYKRQVQTPAACPL